MKHKNSLFKLPNQDYKSNETYALQNGSATDIFEIIWLALICQT